MSDKASKIITDHKKIKEWAEERGGKPANVKGTGSKNEPGILRIYFPDAGKEEGLEEITWEEFFEKFDEKNLGLLMQEDTAKGKQSRFNKLVNRNGNADS